MRHPIYNVLETVIGAVLLGLALLYLVSQEKTLEELTHLSAHEIRQENEFYQQYNKIYSDQITSEELCAVVMGFREYPITIDGVYIGVDGTDYEYYASLIKKGFYDKRYQYHTNHKIIQIDYTYSGV